jgi:hypothetical protein
MVHDHVYSEIAELNTKDLISDKVKNEILSKPPRSNLRPIKIDKKWY